MHNLNIAVVVVLIVVLAAFLYCFPVARGYVVRGAPWIALVGGSVAVGLLISARRADSGSKVYGGAEKSRRHQGGGRNDRGEHEALDEDEALSEDEVLDDYEYLDEPESDAAADEPESDAAADEDDSPGGLGAYVVDT